MTIMLQISLGEERLRILLKLILLNKARQESRKWDHKQQNWKEMTPKEKVKEE